MLKTYYKYKLFIYMFFADSSKYVSSFVLLKEEEQKLSKTVMKKR